MIQIVVLSTDNRLDLVEKCLSILHSKSELPPQCKRAARRLLKALDGDRRNVQLHDIEIVELYGIDD